MGLVADYCSTTLRATEKVRSPSKGSSDTFSFSFRSTLIKERLSRDAFLKRDYDAKPLVALMIASSMLAVRVLMMVRRR